MLTRARNALARLGRILQVLRWRHMRAWLPWLTMGLAFEAIGRWSLFDGIEAAALLGLVLVAFLAQAKYGDAIGAFVQRWIAPRVVPLLEPLTIDMGLDLRGTPPLPRAHPRSWTLLWLGLMGVTAVLFTAAPHLPGDARLVLRQVSGLGWLILMLGLWLSLFGGCAACVMIATAAVREHLVGAGPGSRAGIAWMLFTLGVLCLALPVEACLVALVGIGCVQALADLLLRPRIRILWRAGAVDQGEGEEGSPGQDATEQDAAVESLAGQGTGAQGVESGPPGSRHSTMPASASYPVWRAAFTLAITAMACCLVLLACGDQWRGQSDGQTALTGLLGSLFAKAATFAAGISAVIFQVQLVVGRINDPARSVPRRVRVLEAARSDRRSIQEALGAAGWRVGFEGRPAPVEIRIDPAAEPFDFVLQRSWPLSLAPEHLGDARSHDMLDRRLAVQYRRGVARGIERLMRAAASQSYDEGNGFWFAPHLWYQPVMRRDEGISGAVAPPYRKLFTRGARAHLFELLRDLEIDLIFIEDGVKFRQLQRLFARLFETHDRLGPVRLESTRLLSGVHGIRVVLDEIGLSESSLQGSQGREGYPEPDYQVLGRARILHVFRDRGGDEKPSVVPDSFDFLPVPELTH